MRGGILEHVYMRDIDAGQVAGPAIEVDLQYEEGPNGPFKPQVRDIEVVNVKVKKCKSPWSLRGYKDAPIQDVRIRDCVFDGAAQQAVAENVEGLKLDNVTVNGKKLS
jgi:hypothetical protein